MFVITMTMRPSLVPVLLLATAALSSSTVLPLLSLDKLEPESLSLTGQQTDNIFSNRYQPRNILDDIFYTVSIATSSKNQNKQIPLLVDIDNKKFEDDSNTSRNKEKYNGEGFRKEQWHNYPRQLDRLHKYLYEHHNSDKRNPDPDDPNILSDYSDENALEIPEDVKTNEFPKNTNDDTRIGYDAVVALTNPFLIFKIRLASLNNEIKNNNLNTFSDLMSSEPEYVPENRDDEKQMNAENLQMSVTKVKREEVGPQIAPISESTMKKNRAVKKRIFSLWSRLQSFNHKGHELQHRRHLHAFYGLPADGDASGILTAETRATFMRPPGSPLRWG